MNSFPPEAAGGSRPMGDMWIVAVAIAAIAAILLWLAHHLGLNADEGFYGLAAREVWQGHVPYRDFGFTQMPLFPYVAGASLQLTGHSLLHLRLFCAACAFASLVLAAGWLWRSRGSSAAGVTALLLAGAVGWLSFSVIAKTYALAGFFLTCATVAFLSRGTWPRRLCWLCLCGTLAIACRLTTLPFVGLLGFALIMERRTWGSFASALGMFLAIALFVLGPIATADWEAFNYWTWQFHLGVESRRPPLTRLLAWIALALPVWLAIASVARPVWKAAGEDAMRLRWVLVAVGVTLALTVGPAQGYGEYAAPVVVPAALAAGLGWTASASFARPLLAAALLVPLGWAPCLAPARFSLPAGDPRLFADLREATTRVRALARSDQLVICSVPIVAYEAGAAVPLDLLMGKFSLTAEMDGERASRLGFVTPVQLANAIYSGQAAAVVLFNGDGWNFNWSLPSVRILRPEERAPILQAIELRYDRVLQNTTFQVYAPRAPALADPDHQLPPS